MRKELLISGILISMLSSLNSYGEVFTVGNYMYEEIEREEYTQRSVEVKGPASPYMTTVDIPAVVTYKGITYNVKEIGYTAFEGYNSMLTLIMPNTVEVISDRAFSGCTSLKDIKFSDSLRIIGVSAFSDCTSLTNVTLPASLEVTYETFGGCLSLISIDVEAGNKYYSSYDGVIYDKSGQTLIKCPQGKTGVDFKPNTKIIKSGAFRDCPYISEIILPSTIEKIEQYAFGGCSSLTKFVMNDFITELDGSTFYICNNLKTVKLSSNLINLGNDTFAGCLGLDKIELPATLKYIGNSAFAGTESLKNIEIPESVVFIGDNVFDHGGIESIVIPSKVMNIGQECFQSSALKNIVIPEGVTTIGAAAFRYTPLEKIQIPSTVTFIGVEAFALCEKLRLITSLASNPPKALNAFDQRELDETYLQVVETSETAYKSSVPWREFKNIVNTNYIPVQEITVSIPEKIINVGEEVQLNAIVSPQNATNPVIVWERLDGGCEIDQNGLLKVAEPGNIKIFVSATNGAGYAETELEATALQIYFENVPWEPMKVGEEVEIKSGIYPLEFEDKQIVYASSDEKVAAIDNNGVLKAKTVGNTVITASLKNYPQIKSSFEVAVENIRPESIGIENSPSELTIGETYKINVKVYPEEAVYSELIWTSSNEDIATVSDEGLVTAISEGYAEIYVSIKDYPEISTSFGLNVVPVRAEQIVLNINDTELNIGETVQLEATVLPEDTTDKNVTWSSSDDSVATVSDNGLVTAVSAGSVTITATCGDASAQCEVTVPNPVVDAEQIVLNINDTELNIGETVQLEATVLPEDTTDKNVTWSSSDDSVATVSDSGLVTAVSAGSVTITATCGEAWAQCEIIVLEDAGVETLFANPQNRISVYTTAGILIKKDCTAEDLKTLAKGYYIIVSGKDRYKISI